MITDKEVLKIARLAHLYVSPEELPSLADKLGRIIDYVRQLEAADTSSAQPMSHVHGSTNVYRADEVKPSLEIDALAQNAPAMNGRFIKVPIILE